MAVATKFQNFVAALCRGQHNFETDQLRLALTNTLPDVATAYLLEHIVEIAPGTGYTLGGLPVTTISAGQVGGSWKLVLQDLTVTASGGSLGPFRYGVLLNAIPSSPNDDPLIQMWDVGSNITLTIGQTYTFDFDELAGALIIG